MDYRRPTREVASPQTASDGHVVWCWEGAGPGARLRLHVDQVENNMSTQIDGVAKESRQEILAISKRLWYISGGAAVIGILAPVVLGFWLNSRLASTERSAVRREDVAAAIQQSAKMASARAADDAGLFKQMLDRAAVDVSPLPDVRAARTKGNK